MQALIVRDGLPRHHKHLSQSPIWLKPLVYN